MQEKDEDDSNKMIIDKMILDQVPLPIEYH
jgi:hypothetical protein